MVLRDDSAVGLHDQSRQGPMKLRPAPKLSTCIIAYYIALIVFGMVWPLMVTETAEVGIAKIIEGGLAILLFTHVFFLLAAHIQGDWFSYLMVFGIPVAITSATIKLTGWLRNLVVVGLLFAANCYGLAVAGING
ncbi:MAG: hypothetical protein ACREEP_01900 [Dongiaceae bacterium]